MNDFERKLRQQTFRAPPPELRDAIFKAPSPLIVAQVSAVIDRRYSGVSAPGERWTWGDWFWPSPLAWGALAALWILFAVISWDEHAAAPASPQMAQLPVSPTLLSYHNTREWNDSLILSN